jgi:trimeric autotransporter adhesin
MKTLSLLLLIGSFFVNETNAQDLTIQEIKLANTNGAIGQTISPVVSISNIGSLTASASKVGFFISKDSILTLNDTFIGSADFAALNSGINRNAVATVTLPVTLNVGAHFLFAYADFEGLVLESNEKNNSGYIKINLSIPSKDLSIKSFNPNKNTFTSGDIFTASVIELNSGNTLVLANNVGYYLSEDSLFDPKDVLLNIDTVGIVRANGETVNLTSFNLPSLLTIGNRYIIAFADYGDHVYELNEQNNTAFAKISIVPSAADLSILSLNTEVDSAVRGGYFSPTSTMLNKGNIFLRDLTIGYYLSTDSVLNLGDTFLSSNNFNYLYSGDIALDYPRLLIPSDIPLGKYYILAVADYNNTIDEFDESNNVKSLRIKISEPTIDLYIFGFTVKPIISASDSYLGVDFYEFNSGNTSAATHSINYFLSTDSTYNSEDTFLSSSEVFSYSPANYAYLKPTIYLPASLPSGKYYIIAIADFSNKIVETNEKNNTHIVSINIAAPSFDLAISTFIPSIKSSAGSYVYPTMYENDFGNGHTSPHYVGYFLSVDSVYDVSDTFLAKEYVLATYGGNSTKLTPTLQIPINVSNGVYYIFAVADYQKSVLEINEKNNTVFIKTTLVNAFADLATSFPSSDSVMVIAGTSFSPTVIQQNNGTIFAFNFSVGYFLSTDSVYDSKDVYLSAESVKDTIKDTYTYLNPTIVISATQKPGIYYLLAVSDYLSQIQESDENNNFEALKIRVGISGIDLTIDAISSTNPSTLAGTFMYLNYTEANDGNLDARAHYIGYFLSTDSIYDLSDTYLSTDYLSALKGGNSRILNQALYIPIATPNGKYYIVVVTDYGKNMLETNEDNNTKSLLITIGITPASVDLSFTYFYAETDSVSQGSSLTVNFNEYNSGTSNAESHNVRYYLSSDTILSLDDTYIDFEYVYGISAGTNYSRSTSLDIPFAIPSGNYYLVAVSDFVNQIPETNELNNTFFVQLIVVEPIVAGVDITSNSKMNIQVYPNPSNGTVYFNTLDDSDEIEVLDINNHVLLSKTATSTIDETLDLTSFSSGIYLVRTKKKGVTTSINRIVIN